jgi:hypothetical protein
MPRDYDLTVLIVATRGYVRLAMKLIRELKTHPGVGKHSTQYIILTDKPDFLPDYETCKVPDYDWPELALRRYEMLLSAMPQVGGKRVVMLDADTSVKWPSQSPLPLLLDDSAPLFAVQHWDSRAISGKPSPYCYDSRSMAHITGEEVRASDETYVQGAALGGDRDAFEGTLRQLDARIKTDTANNVTAVWHDESHWNNFVFHNRRHVRIIPDAVWRGHFNISDKGGLTGDQRRSTIRNHE